MLRSWARGDYFRIGRETQINIKRTLNNLDLNFNDFFLTIQEGVKPFFLLSYSGSLIRKRYRLCY